MRDVFRALLTLVMLSATIVAQQDDQGIPTNPMAIINAAATQYGTALPSAGYPPAANPPGTFAGAPIEFTDVKVGEPGGYKMQAKPIEGIICVSTSYANMFALNNLSDLVVTLIHEAIHLKHYNDWTLHCENLSGSAEVVCKATRDCHFNTKIIIPNLPGDQPPFFVEFEDPCAEAFADYEAAQAACEIGCTSTDTQMRKDYMSQAKSLNKKANKEKGACDALVGDGTVNNPGGAPPKCMEPKFFDLDTGAEIFLDSYSGQMCCCDIMTMMVISCDEVEDCNENGIGDSQEIAEDPSLDMDGNGVLDDCEDNT